MRNATISRGSRNQSVSRIVLCSRPCCGARSVNDLLSLVQSEGICVNRLNPPQPSSLTSKPEDAENKL